MMPRGALNAAHVPQVLAAGEVVVSVEDVAANLPVPLTRLGRIDQEGASR